MLLEDAVGDWYDEDDIEDITIGIYLNVIYFWFIGGEVEGDKYGGLKYLMNYCLWKDLKIY